MIYDCTYELTLKQPMQGFGVLTSHTFKNWFITFDSPTGD